MLKTVFFQQGAPVTVMLLLRLSRLSPVVKFSCPDFLLGEGYIDCLLHVDAVKSVAVESGLLKAVVDVLTVASDSLGTRSVEDSVALADAALTALCSVCANSGACAQDVCVVAYGLSIDTGQRARVQGLGVIHAGCG